MSTLKQDDLYTRFVELFMEFFHASPVSFEIVIEHDKFRQLFSYSWDQKELPSKEILVQAIRFQPTSIMVFPEEVEDHVAEAFAMALEKLRIEEHNQEASLPQESQQRAKPGRVPDPKIQKRRDIVKKHIHSPSDFFDEDKKQALLKEFEENEIPPPKNRYGFAKYSGLNWEEIMVQPAKWMNVIDILTRDRFSRKSKITTE